MIPVKLSLRNFMCYREATEVLDLAGVHLACLSGENGAGKSALLEAITWALWGKARNRFIDDELISKGATEMEVDFEFFLNGDLYRIIRKRAMKGKSGTTMLEMMICSEPGSENWRTISGATLRESQARINDLLKIDYSTFINSAFIMQGRADEFTVKNAADRKKVLADILGLEQYDRLEDEAKAESKQRLNLMTDLSGALQRIKRELELRPQHAARLKEVEAALEVSQGELAQMRSTLDDIRRQEQALEHSAARLNDLRDRIQKRERNMDGAKVRITRNDDRRRESEALLAKRKEIERGYALWRELEAREEQLNEEREQLRTLEIEQRTLEGQISTERVRLDSAGTQAEGNIRTISQRLEGRGVVEVQLSGVLDKLSKLQKLQQQLEDTRCTRESLDVRLRTVTSERDALEREGKQIKQKLDMLMQAHAEAQGHTGCPLCGTDLSADALRRVRESYDQEIAEKRRAYSEKQRELDEVNRQIIATESRLAKEREELKPLEMTLRREAELRERQRQLDLDEQSLVKEEAALVQIRTRLADGDYAHEENKRLVAVVAQMRSLSYDPDEHSEVRRKIEDVKAAGYDSKYHQLESAERELGAVLQDLEEDRARLETMRAEQEADRAEELQLAPLVEQLDGVRAQKGAREIEEAVLANSVNGQLEERGELRNMIARCDELEDERSRLTAEYNIASEEKQIYDDLATAFGKRGIQAMIIENIIPEMEEEANALLHRMTDGRMSVQFITQKDAKTVKSVIETLDIEIADEVGTRAYEMYSGGEAFRVNFAIRIALSKLLARRAGTQLQTLVIDEGFGSQDGQGREKLVGAIRSIQDDFEKILVITHIEELKEEFPTRINIVKTGAGSRIMRGDDVD